MIIVSTCTQSNSYMLPVLVHVHFQKYKFINHIRMQPLIFFCSPFLVFCNFILLALLHKWNLFLLYKFNQLQDITDHGKKTKLQSHVFVLVYTVIIPLSFQFPFSIKQQKTLKEHYKNNVDDNLTVSKLYRDHCLITKCIGS